VSYSIQTALVPAPQSYETVDLQIRQDKIAAIGAHLPPADTVADTIIDTVIDGRDKLLLPGFVNAHTHSSELWQRGLIPPLPLELWLAELYDFAPLDPEQIYLSALGTAVETLLSGGTTVVDHLVLIPGREAETIAAAVRAYREVGIRAYVAPLVQDQPFGTGLPTLGTAQASHSPASASPEQVMSTEAVLDLLRDAVRQFHDPVAGINLVVAPTGIQLCSDALFEGCAALSDQHGLCRHAHLLETKAQKILAQEKYGGSAVAHLKRLGYLNQRSSLAHCVWLDDYDIEILAETGATVVHNPLSNLRLGSGIAPLLKYRQAGVNIAFGCDGSASNDSQDLLEAIKIGSILHNTTDFEYRHWITPREAVEMAALGGATGLNAADQIGSLTVGKQADLVLYDLRSLSLLPRTDPIGLLVLGRPTQAVHSVWVNGRQVVAQGELCTIDVNQLRQELFERSAWQSPRQSAMRQSMEFRYRELMGLAI
jgi:cytosine/adenosine deaminase-related metal-dependent hydrolase